MKTIHIFKAGTHRDSKGAELEFSENNLSSAVNAYDPAIHEAPIVIGHPEGNHPAFGWISSLNFEEGTGNVYAQPHQLNADFEEMVAQGAFKKVSASWYLPNHPANPSPGSLYLRHVGFLGAQPPAIKGLQAINFEEADDHIIQFEETFDEAENLTGIVNLFKGLREFLADKFSNDEAERAIPSDTIDELSKQAEPQNDGSESAPQPSDGTPASEDEKQSATSTSEDENNAPADEHAALKKENKKLKAQVASYQEAEAKRAKQAIIQRIDNMVKGGYILPAQREQVVAFCEKLDASATVEFGEGEHKQQATMLDTYLNQFNKKQVMFSEHSAESGELHEPMSAQRITQKAIQYQQEQRKNGNEINMVAAVNYIKSHMEA